MWMIETISYADQTGNDLKNIHLTFFVWRHIMVKIEYPQTVEAEIKTTYAPYRESGGMRAGQKCGLLNGPPRAWSKASVFFSPSIP
jgi:hypothetical protein